MQRIHYCILIITRPDKEIQTGSSIHDQAELIAELIASNQD